MVRPASFGFNEQTALSNTFQSRYQPEGIDINLQAQSEFDAAVKKLESYGVNVIVVEDDAERKNPDAVFPNNWISMHQDGTIVLYPMCTPNRRTERRADILEMLKANYLVRKVVDLSAYENEGIILEGTGSIIFDHPNRLAYACLSPRTNKDLFTEACRILEYTPVAFTAVDKQGTEIYHTNVLMCVAEKYVIICRDAVTDAREWNLLTDTFHSTGKEIVDISFEQMSSFAGNMLALRAEQQEILAMSQSAFDSLHEDQKNILQKYCTPVPLSIPTIETIGGGSARCMIAENFLPAKNS